MKLLFFPLSQVDKFLEDELSDIRISIQQHDFDVCAEFAALRAYKDRIENDAIGALVSFVGLVRDFSADQKIEKLTLEHYPGMSEKALSNILDEAHARWGLIASRVIHRVGVLRPSEQIVFVAAAAAHRAPAFAATEFIIDYLKTSAPFWKKEHTPHNAEWLETKATDVQRSARWQTFPGETACR